MTARTRLLITVLAAVGLVAGAAIFVWARATQQQPAPTGIPSTAPAAVVENQPRVVFRHAGLGPAYGKVAMVPLSAPDGPRAILDLQCDRVFATRARTLCLASEPGLVTTYSAKVYDDVESAGTSLILAGSPSRARLSADGLRAATTSFVAGDSYAATSFSTRTVVTRLIDGETSDLEDFALHDRGRRVSPVDRNYWGVTFGDKGVFYVTVAYGGGTHLARGELSARRLDVIATDAECPSLSPDGTRVAYKTRGARARGDWRLVVLDLATGRETQLAERRSVDDQVEWLDDQRVLYGMPGEGSRAGESDVWVASADGLGSPTVLIPDAWSPAVVH